MINRVEIKDFKGQTGSFDLGDKTLIIGPNGSGKTAIVQALQMALVGSIPGVGKTNPAIHDAFATADKMGVKVATGDMVFSRAFNKKGDSVTQVFGAGKGKATKATKDKFTVALHDAGSPVVVDVSAFMDLSAEKKVEYLVDLYPPEGDLSALEKSLEDSRESLRAKQGELKGVESSLEAMNAERYAIELPAGTAEECLAAIEAAKAGLTDAESELEQIDMAAAEAKAKADAITEQNKKQQDAIRAQEQMMRDRAKNPKTADDIPQSHGRTVAENILTRRAAHLPERPAASESIQAIIDAMGKTGCGMCGAMLVARRELKKF